MLTKDLLAHITQGAIDYVEYASADKSGAEPMLEHFRFAIGGANRRDLAQLQKLFDEQVFVAKGFADTSLDILEFDWHGVEQERNWWWQLQALPFLNWYTGSFGLLTPEQQHTYFSLCLDAVVNWNTRACDNRESPLVWHDHAAAFRVRNLTNWLLFCHLSGLPLGEDSRAEFLGALVLQHLDWIQNDLHYTRHTNHGFDQAMIALTVANMFSGEQFDKYRQLNRKRLRDEITFAFTGQGVHKENSPGYQKTMLERLRQLPTLGVLGEHEMCELGERYLAGARAFMQAITLPDGCFPMIGDTRGADKGEAYVQQQQIDVLDYSASGYVIVRGTMDNGLEFFLLVKNTHESNYHRHDDDLMVYLYIDGEVVLGDAGLGMYMEKDPRRQYVRSVLGHSVPVLEGRFERQRDRLPVMPTLELDTERGVMCASSYGFGKKIERVVDFSRMREGVLLIEDSCEHKDIACNWYFGDQQVSLGACGIELRFSGFNVALSTQQELPYKLLRGWVEGDPASSALVSETYNEFALATRCVVGGEVRNITTRLSVDRQE